MNFRVATLALAVPLLLASVVEAQDLFAVDGNFGNPSSLYRLERDTEKENHQREDEDRKRRRPGRKPTFIHFRKNVF